MLYKGDVDFSLKIKGKQYLLKSHNAGTTYLKYLFAKTLYGQIDDKDIPWYVGIWYESPSGEITQFTRKQIPISGRQLNTKVGKYNTVVTFTANIKYEDLLEAVDINDQKQYWFYLFPKEGTDHIAQINVSPKNLSYITVGTTATLTWNLRLLNYNEF